MQQRIERALEIDPVTVRKNESHLCEAVIQLLEETLGLERRDVTFPELDGSGPPVEVRTRLGEVRYAIEHTLIEPFPKAIQTGMAFQELAAAIGAELDGTMPSPGTYTLLFPEEPTAGRPRHTHEELRAAIISWVQAAGNLLHAEAPERLDRNRLPSGHFGTISEEVDGLALTLQRRVHWSESGRRDGVLFLSRVVGSDLEERRRQRIQRALDKKLPKLVACAEEGDVTILILEFSDIVLTNHVLIAQALERLLAERHDGADYIFIADTTLDQQWHLFQPVIDREFSMDMEYIEISPPQLAA